MRCLKLILLITLLAGCRTFEVGIELAVTPTSRSTNIAAQTTETPTPTVTLTSTPTVMLTSTPIMLPTSTATSTPAATRQPSVQPTSTSTVQVPAPTATPENPIILSFSVEPLEVDPGGEVTVRWSVSNANSINIYQRVPDTLPAYNTVNLSAAGQITQTIRTGQRLWQAFELSASNEFGVVTQTIALTVRCPYAYFFSSLPVEDQTDWSCPDGEPVTSAAAEEVFEDGRMMWLQHDDLIYVFFDDGTYQTFEDTWVAGQPDSVPGLTPLAGRFMPVRGFGKVWSGDANIRSRLGWALDEEQGFETQIQGGWLRCCSRLNAVNRPIYLRNSEGRIIRLWPGEMPPGQWRFITP